VVNDANAAAWGEFRHGSGRGLDPLLVVTLGTGVGGGLILQQQLWSGAAGTAGEIGHLPVEGGGRLCGCGSRGCLETYASVSGIVRSVEESLSHGAASQLAGVTRLDGAMIAKAAISGDRVALQAFELAGHMLGLALAGVVNLLSLRGVVITGGGSAGIDLLMPAIRTELQSRVHSAALAQLTVQCGLLGERAALLGAAELGFAHLL
jgi:glucokinase